MALGKLVVRLSEACRLAMELTFSAPTDMPLAPDTTMSASLPQPLFQEKAEGV